MIDLLKREVNKHGDDLRILSIERLNDLKNDINDLEKNYDLNRFQKHIINKMYEFELPAISFAAKSIIIIAVPKPMYANVEFKYQGKEYSLLSPTISDLEITEKYLNEFLSPKNYHIKFTEHLPIKLLAVRSGLATYGRNNICYVEGMGSSITLVAYFTDIQCVDDDWTNVSKASICSNCNACINHCPTNAISKDRFLIDTEKCLSYYNESPLEIPEWIPSSAHNCVYDCMKCQYVCPMNKEYVNNVFGPVKFSEKETGMIMSGVKLQNLSPELQKKVKVLGMDQWYQAMPRNLSLLFEIYGSDHYNPF